MGGIGDDIWSGRGAQVMCEGDGSVTESHQAMGSILKISRRLRFEAAQAMTRSLTPGAS